MGRKLGLRFDGARLYIHRDVVVCRRAFRGKVRRRRVLGPVGTGPRLERRSLYKDLGSFPLHRLRLSAGGRPRRGVRCCAERCVRPLATFTSRGPRRQTAGMEFGATTGVAVRSSPPPWIRPLGLLSGCSLPPAADRSRRLSAPREVSRPLAGHPRGLASLVRAPFDSRKGLIGWTPAGSLCDAGLTRRAPGTWPPTLRHGPPGLAPDIRSDEGRRRRRQRRWRLGEAFNRF